jgi:hypothetical protein
MFGFVIAGVSLAGLIYLAAKRRRYGGYGAYWAFRRLDTSPGQEKVIRTAISEAREVWRDYRKSNQGAKEQLVPILEAEVLDEHAVSSWLGELARRAAAFAGRAEGAALGHRQAHSRRARPRATPQSRPLRRQLGRPLRAPLPRLSWPPRLLNRTRKEICIMRHTFIKVLLTIGLVGGLIAGFAGCHHHGHHGRYEYMEQKVTEVCTTATKAALAEDRANHPAPPPPPPPAAPAAAPAPAP